MLRTSAKSTALMGSIEPAIPENKHPTGKKYQLLLQLVHYSSLLNALRPVDQDVTCSSLRSGRSEVQIGHSVANGSPLLQHFFGRS